MLLIAMETATLAVQDMFYSFQGEGPWIGYPQIFLRLYGCNIHCDYCDEPDRNKQRFSIPEIISRMSQWMDKPLHSLSLTGGEPLLQVAGIMELVQKISMPIYLETNGTLPEALDKVMPYCHYFSVDYKPGHLPKFTEFMTRLISTQNVFVKYVLTQNAPISEVVNLCTVIHQLNPDWPLVIQPVTPFGSVTTRPSPKEIAITHETASSLISNVRVIPQTHKLIGLR